MYCNVEGSTLEIAGLNVLFEIFAAINGLALIVFEACLDNGLGLVFAVDDICHGIICGCGLEGTIRSLNFDVVVGICINRADLEVNDDVTVGENKLCIVIAVAGGVCGRRGCYSSNTVIIQSKAHSNRIIHLMHMCIIQMSHMLTQTTFIDRSDLLHQNYRVFTQPYTSARNINMHRRGVQVG